jgi:hypothetical protein
MVGGIEGLIGAAILAMSCRSKVPRVAVGAGGSGSSPNLRQNRDLNAVGCNSEPWGDASIPLSFFLLFLSLCQMVVRFRQIDDRWGERFTLRRGDR